ncbi:hypothetical protein F5884DRAFT_769163 [Xylogone sp. PMI_703]|nr:hypothetical protein F5884DRAFT_769163 [Xylogone sp. PMI_703]
MSGDSDFEKADFTPLAQSEEDAELIQQHPNLKKTQRLFRRNNLIWALLCLELLTICITSVLVGFWLGGKYNRQNQDKYCIRHVSEYSPVLKDVDISFHTVRFNGSLFKENIFRQDASPEVDKAWESLGVDYRAAIISPEKARGSYLSPDQVQISDKYGGGWVANVEGLHHLHCLNLLRKSLYYNYDYYHNLGKGAFKNSDDIVRFHVSHCLDILRQQLMCTVDIGMLGQVWWNRTRPHAYPDFNTQHTCRNFEAVRKWAEDHQAPEDVPNDFLKRPVDMNIVYETLP